jgi:SAM-dependent methyltransferase
LTGYSIYNAIIRPLTQAMIVGDEPIPQSYWRAGDKSLIKAMLSFHSHVKIMAYEKYTKHALATLELGGGQANDFKKWIKAGIENVTIIEPDLDAIKEAEDRTRSIKKPVIEFINDSAGKDLTMLLEENNSKNRKFDAIIANFSVHYFIENKEQIGLLIENCKKLLKPNGYFIFTTFSGERVFIDLAKYNPLVLKSQEQKDKVLFSIEALYPTTDPKIKHYGQKIKVFVESIGVAHEESLVNIKYIIDKFLETNEFTLVENTPFSDILEDYPDKGTLTEPERVYSSFNNLVVLKNGGGARAEHPPAKVASEKKSMGVKKNSNSK